MLINETLRFCPSVPMSSPHYPKKDVKLGKYHFKKGDLIIVNIESLGHNPSEWQRPTEMIPERFDNDDPLSLRPDGKKRHPYSWVPFVGGSRVCFGKSQAEYNMKIFTLFVTQKFNFEFEDKRYNKEIPLAQLEMSHARPVWLKLTPFTKV